MRRVNISDFIFFVDDVGEFFCVYFEDFLFCFMRMYIMELVYFNGCRFWYICVLFKCLGKFVFGYSIS